MIERFNIDASLGNDDQAGLFIHADEQAAQRFRRLLWQQGIYTVPFMTSRREGYTFFTYASVPNQDSTTVVQQMRPICEANSATTTTHIGYDAWHTAFTTYVHAYRDRRIPRPNSQATNVFDKSRPYQLIGDGHYSEAESYLTPFATDNPPNLLPAYLVYLYHQWNRPQDVVQVHARYGEQLQAGDVDHRVIEWIVAAYLHLVPPQPQDALMVLADFLPEFQRQGVAETLLALRAQARALQGQLPQTPTDLRLYLQHTQATSLNERVADLLEVITGLSAPATVIAELLENLAARIDEPQQWRILLAQSELAQRQQDFDSALGYLQTILNAPPDSLDKSDLARLLLKLAELYFQTNQAQNTADSLTAFTPETLNREGQQAYWQLLGQASLSLDAPTALDALRQAYELGSRQPEVLQPLARLAYQAEDWELARLVYDELLQGGFEPRPEDYLYAGTLAWLSGQPKEAVERLQRLADVPDVTLPASAVALAYEAWVNSLAEINATIDQQVAAISAWTDWLVVQQDLEGLLALADYTLQTGFDRLATFTLLEPLETALAEDASGKEKLVLAYMELFVAEVNESLRWERPLPDYILYLRRALFDLDRAQFNFAQEYLQAELAKAHEAEILTADFEVEPTAEPSLDLSGYWIALVGGYAPVRRRVREKLEREYRIGRFTEVPPSWEEHVDQKRVAEAVLGADLIVVVHRCIKHDGTDSLKATIEGTEAENRVRYASGKGQSSIICTIQEHLA